jgi:hypothetical protein
MFGIIQGFRTIGNEAFLNRGTRHGETQRAFAKDVPERDLCCWPTMEINNKLTGIIRGRSIELVTQEEGLVTIVFRDYSTTRAKVTGAPTTNMLGELSFQSAIMPPSKRLG